MQNQSVDAAAAPPGNELIRRSERGTPAVSSEAVAVGRPTTDATNRKNMMLLIQLRWIAVVGQVVTIAIVQFGLGIALPLVPMLVVLAALAALNLTSLLWVRNRTDVSNHALLMVLMLDVAALTACFYSPKTLP